MPPRAARKLRHAVGLAERDGILVRAGSEFGLPGYIRVTTAAQDLMADVGARIAAAVR